MNRSSTQEIPEGLLINGFIQDEEGFARWAKSLADQLELKGKKVTVIADSTAVIYRQIETPKLKPKTLEKNLYFNLARQIGNIAENTVDYAVMPQAENGSESLTGIKPQHLITSTLALIQAGLFLKEEKTAITPGVPMKSVRRCCSTTEDLCFPTFFALTAIRLR